MEFKDLGNLIAKFAPMIAASLGGPLAGTAITALEAVFGLGEGSTKEEREKSLVEAINGATPDTLLALKKADQEYAVKMAELGFRNVEALLSLAISDKDSARKREIEVRDNTPKILAYTITLGFFFTLGYMLMSTVPEGSRDLLNILIGMLGGSFLGIKEYYFGSSAGSSEKTKIIANKD